MLLKNLEDVDEIYTYNGSRFDLSLIESKLRIDLRQCFKHTDLMYDCWRQNLKGGLNTAVLPCTEPQAENSGIDFTSCFATAYDNMRVDANQDSLCLIPPRGVEPLSPG